ncbi:hypothetical protein U1P98_11120 [Lysinibacillus irui]|uniref:S1 motif domain-containing protein n=1 Tax=Lysinibacillus irui TaxID=2998077 RepID=A0ABU5NLD9_9BACI|nr:hypothetical protein [Lysinibacillus irui]MEA0555132.1 hypothetical protein [Lysinibacillus irui]MEA0976847.1 hypothetical protein [Lysinibacillus irui]MEA1043001.1 hypothetical protein [Lysinibacillus irui]
MKKYSYIIMIMLLLVVGLAFNQPAKAAQLVTGTFVDVTFSEYTKPDGTIEQQLSKVTLQNDRGRTVTFNINKNTRLYINNTATTIEGFKMGMEVEAEISLRSVVELRGTSTTATEPNGSSAGSGSSSKTTAGVVTSIDPNGLFIIVKPDVGEETTYYINKETNYQKGSSATDISALYVGDRVKLNFKNKNTSVVTKVAISETGTLVENLYKGEIQAVNPNANKLTVKNQHAFINWQFGSQTTNDLSTMSFTSKVPIYVGNTKVEKGQLKNYIGSEAYYATVKQFGKEVIEKIVVLKNNERTYYEPMLSVDTDYQLLKLKSAGTLYFHNGTILIRNGRLIEPTGLLAYGTAFVIADGAARDHYAQVVQVTSDSFMSPNLAGHELYYGRLSQADGYLIEIDDAMKIESNVFKKTDDTVLSVSNSTKAMVDDGNKTYSVMPDIELYLSEGDYGYFYVKDGHVQALHILDNAKPVAPLMLTGKLQSVKSKYPAVINVKSVSQWQNGRWYEAGEMVDMNIDQATIIKAGKVIQPSDLQASDRLVVLSDRFVKAHFILVD